MILPHLRCIPFLSFLQLTSQSPTPARSASSSTFSCQHATAQTHLSLRLAFHAMPNPPALVQPCYTWCMSLHSLDRLFKPLHRLTVSSQRSLIAWQLCAHHSHSTLAHWLAACLFASPHCSLSHNAAPARFNHATLGASPSTASIISSMTESVSSNCNSVPHSVGLSASLCWSQYLTLSVQLTRSDCLTLAAPHPPSHLHCNTPTVSPTLYHSQCLTNVVSLPPLAVIAITGCH